MSKTTNCCKASDIKDILLKGEAGMASVFLRSCKDCIKTDFTSFYKWDNKRKLFVSCTKHDCLQFILQILDAAFAALITQSRKEGSAADVRLLSKQRELIHKPTSLKRVFALICNAIHQPDLEEKLNKDPYVLPIIPGRIFDFNNMKTRPRTKSDLFTTECPICFDEEIDEERCKDVLEYFYYLFEGKEDIIDYVLQILGQSLMGTTQEQFYVLYDVSSAKASTLMNLMERILGPVLFQQVPISLLEGKLKNFQTQARCYSIVGASDSLTLDEISVGKLVHAFLFVNSLPHFDFRNPVFEHKLCPLATFQQCDPSPQLFDKLQLSAVFTVLCRAAHKSIRQQVTMPEIIRARVKTWIRQEDFLGTFIDTCCVSSPSNSIQTSLFHALFDTWCSDKGAKMSAMEIKRELLRRGFGVNGRLYLGLTCQL